MNFIKNLTDLIKTQERRIALEIIEAGLKAIQPDAVIHKTILLTGNQLKVKEKVFDLSHYERIFLIGFGKGSSIISHEIAQILQKRLIEGFVIDNVAQTAMSPPIIYMHGTHPIPSEENFSFTKQIIEQMKNMQLTERDLVLVVVCGGGSAMFIQPNKVSREKKIAITQALLKSGADIIQINTIRKHLSKVKGGGLAAMLYPATVATLIFSDVPGNDSSYIASGPTVFDTTTKEDAWRLIKQYHIERVFPITKDDLSETPKEKQYFKHVFNQIVLSNQNALCAMEKKAHEAGYTPFLYSDTVQGEARFVGKNLIDKTPKNTILLAGGETTVKVVGQGQGGRNQEVVLGALPFVGRNTTIISFGSDGWDNIHFAGAIGDCLTVEKLQSLGLDVDIYLNNNNSLEFFKKTNDGIVTGRLPSNVSDLFIVLKKR